MANFRKEVISTGETFSFEKIPATVKLEKICVCAGWDPTRMGANVDLDISLLFLDADNNEVDIVFFGNKTSKDGSTKHSGDDTTGSSSAGGDDETITIETAKLSDKVTSIIATVTSYSGQKLDNVKNAYCRLVDKSTSEEVELVRYELNTAVAKTAMVVAKLHLEGGEWKFKAVGLPTDGKTVADLRSIAKTV